jgi:hypothetical protein
MLTNEIQNSYFEGQGHNMDQKKRVQIIDHETLYRKQNKPHCFVVVMLSLLTCICLMTCLLLSLTHVDLSSTVIML